MSEIENAIEEQHRQVAKHKKAHEKRMLRNTKDIRDEIAHGAHYEPKDDPIYEYVEYPKYVTLKNNDQQIIVHSKAEENAALGIKSEPAKVAMVDVAALAHVEQSAPAKRKYTKRAAAPLPATLD